MYEIILSLGSYNKEKVTLVVLTDCKFAKKRCEDRRKSGMQEVRQTEVTNFIHSEPPTLGTQC